MRIPVFWKIFAQKILLGRFCQKIFTVGDLIDDASQAGYAHDRRRHHASVFGRLIGDENGGQALGLRLPFIPLFPHVLQGAVERA
jgi:hypothetical protein